MQRSIGDCCPQLFNNAGSRELMLSNLRSSVNEAVPNRLGLPMVTSFQNIDCICKGSHMVWEIDPLFLSFPVVGGRPKTRILAAYFLRLPLPRKCRVLFLTEVKPEFQRRRPAVQRQYR